MRHRFTLDIVGPKPSEVELSDLIAVLQEVTKAIGALIGESVATGDIASLSLVGIVEGSDGLVLEVRREGVEAARKLARAVKTGRYTELPRTTHTALHAMTQIARRREWGGFRLRKSAKLELPNAVVIAVDSVPSPAERPVVRGTTTLLARCLRAGGVTPKAELRLVDSPELLHIEVTEAIARDLGHRLYDEVVLHGDAEWDTKSLELQAFRATSVSTFYRVPVTDGFAQLAELARGRWNEVDADAFVANVRDGVN